MRRDDSKDVYLYIKKFADEFILKGNSIFTEDKNILTPGSIQKCVQMFIDNADASDKGFDEKVSIQFKEADKATCLVFAHAEWLWSFAVNDLSQYRKQSYVRRMLKNGNANENKLSNVFPKGFGHAGMYHKSNKYYEICFAIHIISLLESKVRNGEIKSTEEVFEWMEKTAIFQKYKKEFESHPLPEDFKNSIKTHKIDKKLAIGNIICHVIFPEKYERIASNQHKKQILNSFYDFLPDDDKKNKELTVDEKIYSIRKVLENDCKLKNFDFYDNKKVSQIWDPSIDEKEIFSELQGLEYKKAIILYGPPGTSKTYTATKLAQQLITKAYLKYLKKEKRVSGYFKDKDDSHTKGRIHHLQLHANYNYEDFVAGIKLCNHNTQPEKGKMFEICDAALKDKENNMPHVLILDEINRIDLSRLFGEVFSALEDREVPISVSIGGFDLVIPYNLYVIGTMNEIDFSLEQLDFALRRRFLWFFYGFNKEILNDIIWDKNEKLKTNLSTDEVDTFIVRAQTFNDRLISLPELGKEYQIGHTFFAEIVDIFSTYMKLNSYTREQKIFKKGGPVEILWDVSIEPIVSAFLGNLDKDSKENRLKELKAIFVDE